MTKIKVLVVDDILATRENIRKLLDFHPEITVCGTAGSGEEAVLKAKELQPDIVLMDINMPGMDGIAASEIITTGIPSATVIMMSVQGEHEYLRRAMMAGAKNYLVKPFTGDELLQAVKQSYLTEQKRRNVIKLEPKQSEPGKVITVFSTKGGIGKTTIATNLAVALAAKTRARVAILDADLQFGDVALFLNLMPRVTIADLVKDIDSLDENLLDNYMTDYNGRVSVLPAPLRPEQADTVTGAHLAAIIKLMRTKFQYIVIDTAPSFNDAMLSVLDAADQLLVVSAMDLPTIKNVRLCLDIMDSLNYSDEKIKLVLNRASSESGMDMREVEESLRRPFAGALPSDGKTVVASVNRGVPFVESHPDSPVAQSMFNLVKLISQAEGIEHEEPKEPKGVVHKLKRLFG